MNYNEVLEEHADTTRARMAEQAAVKSFGVESENPVEHLDGAIPSNREYQEVLNRIDKSLKNPDLREQFGFDRNPVGDKSSSAMLPGDLPVELTLQPGHLMSRSERVKGAKPVYDFDLGPQLEMTPGASQKVIDPAIEGLQRMKQVAEKSLPEDMRFSEWSFLEPLRREESEHRIDWSLEESDITGSELMQNLPGFPTEVGYYPDYVRLLGPAVATNGFAGSTQTTGPMSKSHDSWDETFYSELVGMGDKPGRLAIERGKDYLTSNAFIEEDGEVNFTDVGDPYWNAAYSTSPLVDSAEAEDRFGFPHQLVDRLESSPEEEAITHYLDHMNGYTKVFFEKPDREYVEFDGAGLESWDVDYDEIPLLAADPDNPVSQKEFMNGETARFSKYVEDENGSTGIVTGEINLEDMPDSEKQEYFWSDVNKHYTTVHHDIRLKPAIGATEQRTDRMAAEYEPEVVTLQSALKHVGPEIQDIAAEYGINNEEVPDDSDTWRSFWADSADILYETAEDITVQNSPYPKRLEDFIHDVQENGNPAQQRYREKPQMVEPRATR